MGRLTRSESQAQTRAHLVSTARDLFLADGYAGTSLEKVADAAGYSKGAVYSNFKNKKELCLEVLGSIHATKGAEIAAALGHGDTVEDRLGAFESWAENTLGDVGWTMLEFELIVLSRHDPELREALTATLGAARDIAVKLLTSFTESLGVTLPMPAEDAASSILGLGVGLGIQRAIDPTISARVVTDSLRVLLATSSPM
ncbi:MULTISPECIES: TetR/AcrR family transcriptional regulator [Rhodococcus]|jgi:AcrR family transcriptional regulator|uniref:TetR/AcrR family transcriptional regulator n=1 Tax=Rhodococcus oxybenzonivorans TaxID=1990687 RepID=A0AAE4V3U4_9NOCA|nr:MULTISPECIES: TetR/AcrR family transcriptional regulator [Rhodococcus]MDV7245167.1 TetR/AcrR family transcriptional regulator [Rhodococcus oxybenzonivorans]MDV7268063.1 TetR/AcrR family transcriptional regulator [Rhodococcus oxybenzonivorans]MDV7272551.1 TetR/AcrR family transcriptional regulator [Rhodococcus oxybenzonivorans]MDV7336192.1 TetR/AcrR family transcriptional regulator [Rhodococcus oxybenzonivorans]MDV7342877.1 TetR/AcrR family transcriptional regulator [Rhodococcus oxybenzonivo